MYAEKQNNPAKKYRQILVEKQSRILKAKCNYGQYMYADYVWFPCNNID